MLHHIEDEKTPGLPLEMELVLLLSPGAQVLPHGLGARAGQRDGHPLQTEPLALLLVPPMF